MDTTHASDIHEQWWEHGAILPRPHEAESEPPDEAGEAGPPDEVEAGDELADADIEPPDDAVDVDAEGPDGDGEAEANFDLDTDDLDIEFEPDTEPETDESGGPDAGVNAAALSDTPGARDERINDYGGSADHEEVREYLRTTGIADDVQDALADLGETEEERAVAEGDVLDMRNVTRRLAGDTEVEDIWRRRERHPGDEIAVGVSLDMSGSMSSAERDTKAAVGAFLYAVEQFGRGEVVANAWKAEGVEAEVQLLTAPYEPFLWGHLDATEPGGGTPTGAGIREAGLLLDRCTSERKLLFVLTDGKPTAHSDATDYQNGTEEAIGAVDDCRSRGIEVTGFGFGAVSERKLVEMFGEEHAHHVDVEELSDALTEEYADARDEPDIPV